MFHLTKNLSAHLTHYLCAVLPKIVRDATLPTIEQYIDERLTSAWEHDALHRALENLTEQEYEVIFKIYWEGYSETELAIEYGITRQGMNKKVHRILGKLLKMIEK